MRCPACKQYVPDGLGLKICPSCNADLTDIAHAKTVSAADAANPIVPEQKMALGAVETGRQLKKIFIVIIFIFISIGLAVFGYYGYTVLTMKKLITESFQPLTKMASSETFFDYLTKDYSYGYKTKISDLGLLTLCEGVITQGFEYFVLLNDVKEDPEARWMGSLDGLAIKPYKDRPAKSNFAVFNARDLRYAIREKNGFVAKDAEELNRLARDLAAKPDDLQLLTEKIRILEGRAVYGEDEWEPYVQAKIQKIDVMLKRGMINAPDFMFESEGFVMMLVCLNKTKELNEFRAKYEKNGGQAFDVRFAAMQLGKSLCHLIGLKDQ